jgi:hypothetical protein
MDVVISNIGVSKEVFIDKINNELKHGVKVRTGNIECVDIVRAWTDTKNWQFSLIGLYVCETKKLESLMIQSIGVSKEYVQLKVRIENFDFKMERISNKFGVMQGISEKEAKEFMDGFMQSKFNRFLTEQLFKEMAADEDYQQWLIF